MFDQANPPALFVTHAQPCSLGSTFLKKAIEYNKRGVAAFLRSHLVMLAFLCSVGVAELAHAPSNVPFAITNAMCRHSCAEAFAGRGRAMQADDDAFNFAAVAIKNKVLGKRLNNSSNEQIIRNNDNTCYRDTDDHSLRDSHRGCML
jgi:hypothetical protein